MLIKQNSISTELVMFLNQQNYSKIYVLVDENTAFFCLNLLDLKNKHEVITIKSGEINKNIETCKIIWSFLLETNADRKALFINLGGGVISDMGGFCASVYKRGIDFINIPTTLLAQVDASIGAKTAIDFEGQKNMIGLFSEPKKILIDSIFLKTLPERELKSGFAEVLKHGLIADKKYFETSMETFLNKTIQWSEIIEKSIEIKRKIVAQDPKEAGLRKILNFGHTIGHALETYSLEKHQKPLLHGEAIVLGMIAELYLSFKKEFISKEILLEYIDKLLEIYSFQNIEKFDLEKVLSFVLNDKKNVNNEIQIVLLKEIGKAIYDQKVSENELLSSLDFLFKTIENA